MPISVASLPWLQGRIDPVEIITRAIASRGQDADRALRRQEMAQTASRVAAELAQRQAEEVAQQQRFVQDLALRRENQNLAAREAAEKNALSRRELDLMTAEKTDKSKTEAIRFQGLQDYQNDIARGIKPADAILKHGAKMFYKGSEFPNFLLGQERNRAASERFDQTQLDKFAIEKMKEEAKGNKPVSDYEKERTRKTKLEADALETKNSGGYREKLTASDLETIVSGLSELKKEKVDSAQVDEKKVVVRKPGFFQNDTPIDELIQEYSNRLNKAKAKAGAVPVTTGTPSSSAKTREALGGFVIGKKYKTASGPITYLGGDPNDPASWE
jgi:hypothetical protein